ncbi:GDSL-type esterase/lipase family protein [Alkalinema pantanalense CENA528]|uniref:GDSL-type esterase/lipase family protein n=1 Tax=Alkalinema pantanalense TaxID=1620705 RepID=UPI003D6F6355
MSDLCLLAISLSQAPGQRTDSPIVPPSTYLQSSRQTPRPTSQKKIVVQPRVPHELAQKPEFSRSSDSPMRSTSGLPTKATPKGPTAAKLKTASLKTTSKRIAIAPNPQTRISPRSGIQLYRQRLTSLRQGRLYTRLPVDSFYEAWRSAQGQPTYQQWRRLLSLEARAVSRRQDKRPLMVMVGDSLSQWYPSDYLPSRDIWLNQGISGDTTRGILQRLDDFATARPDRIYVMAGVNDLKRGASDREILQNLAKIIARLQRQHPQAEIVVQSILPTRSSMIPNDRIETLNQQLAQLTTRQGAAFLDLYREFVDRDGYLQQQLSTDGIHLNLQGYQVWQTALSQAKPAIASLVRKPQAKNG